MQKYGDFGSSKNGSTEQNCVTWLIFQGLKITQVFKIEPKNFGILFESYSWTKYHGQSFFGDYHYLKLVNLSDSYGQCLLRCFHTGLRDFLWISIIGGIKYAMSNNDKNIQDRQTERVNNPKWWTMGYLVWTSKFCS